MDKRSEVSRPVVLGFARDVDTGKGFVDGHTEIRITFVVFQFHIVARLMRLNQVIF